MEARRVHATREDITLLRNVHPAERHPKSEDFAKDSYLNEFIPKPWGHEYRVYIDNLYDIWKLTLTPGHRTSTHCHPRKDTVLLCLAGVGELKSATGEQTVRRGQTVHIKKGAFHSTANIGDEDLDLIEIETPRNKFDLVRVGDHYGRTATQYESEGLNVHALPPLAPVEFDKIALLRKTDLFGKYRFSLNSYANLVDSHEVICHINVDMEPFLEDRISIVSTTDQMTQTEKEHGLFLTVSAIPTASKHL
jgi:mannose-6-phosphate isomerase-like protein (cupin superfamily)